jgi:methyl-CpG-binding domain protein 4
MKRKACYVWKTEQAKRVYTLLAALKPRVRGKYAEVVLEKCLLDFLSELKRLHVCISCRLSRDRRGDQELRQSRKLLSSLVSGLERRIRIQQLPKSRWTKSEEEEEVEVEGKRVKTTLTIETLRLRCPRFSQDRSWRHLCEHCCYYREHEPARKMKELLDCWDFHQLLERKDRQNKSSSSGSGVRGMTVDWSQWYTKLEICTKSKGQFRVVFVSPEGHVFRTVKQAMQHLGVCVDENYRVVSLYEERSRDQSIAEEEGGEGLSQQALQKAMPGCGEREREKERDLDVCSLESPYGLIEELFPNDPWKLLVCCLLLNLTTRKQLDPVLYNFFGAFPTPESLLQCENNQNKICQIIAPLGLQRRRTQTLLRFSQEFLEWRKRWNTNNTSMEVKGLHGVGDYAQQAFEIFCLRKVKGPKLGAVDDHALNWYLDWALKQASGAEAL